MSSEKADFAVDYIEPKYSQIESSKSEIPFDTPERIFKGRSWSAPFHSRILSHQEIYFPSVPELSDPDDCRFGVDFDLSYPVVFDAFKEEARKSLVEQGIRINGENVGIRVERFYNNTFGSDDLKQQWIDKFWKQNNELFYVFCIAKSCDNPKFWEEHCAGYTGFAVEFDLHSIMQDVFEGMSMGGHVRYFPRGSANLNYHFTGGTNSHLRQELLIDLATSKYEDFDFENEYRLLRLDMTGHPRAKPVSKTYQVPKHGIVSVIFGENISPQDEKEIRDTCNSEGLTVTFRKAYRKGDAVDIRNV